MTWFAGHIISYVKFIDGIQDSYPVWKNVVLIEAESDAKAFEEAERIGKAYYDDSADVETADLTWDERPAYWVFAGVRKLIEITETAATIMEQPQPWDRPGHGTEITYSEMVVDSADALSKLVNGGPVAVLYEK
jgi:hypothetical protein